MNKHKYSLLKLINFLTGLCLSIIYSYILTDREKRIIFNATNNEHFIFNSKSLFVDKKEEFVRAGFQVYFVINDPVKRARLNRHYADSMISNKGLKHKLFILRSAVWVTSTLDMPVSGVFLSRKRFVYHLGHGTPIKNIGLMEAQCSLIKRLYYKVNASNISLFLAPSHFFQEYISRAFGVRVDKTIIAPQPRLDSLFTSTNKWGDLKSDINTKLVLYCPTWRPFSEAKLFPFNELDLDVLNSFLIEQNTKILLRLHPLFEGDLSVYVKSHIVIFDSKICPDISDVLINMDALITDYSSIYCDFYLLDRPVAFIPYDLKEYTSKIGFSFKYEDLTSDCYLNNLSGFKAFISNVADGKFDLSKQNVMKHRFNYIADVSASQFNYDLIIKKYKELV
ncbi:CDP-glycerol glycerophosphotransferase family protein [Psychromonas sp. PT13]|uniref:CDP-glycerol glycerophosphotransferase family protein n=1 Tax=Psychromonas sp. PT13 TaxID=3439547 RepID=UPI003EBC0955